MMPFHKAPFLGLKFIKMKFHLSTLPYGEWEWKTDIELVPDCRTDVCLANKAWFWHLGIAGVGADFIRSNQTLQCQIFLKITFQRGKKSYGSVRCDTDAKLLSEKLLTSPVKSSCARLCLHPWWAIICYRSRSPDYPQIIPLDYLGD